MPKTYYNNQLVLELDFNANISKILVNSYQDLPVKVGDSIIHIFADEGLTSFYDSFSQTLNGNISLGTKALLYNYEEVFMFMLKSQNEITFFTLSIQEEIMNLFDEIIKVNNDQMKSIRNLYKKLSDHEENYGFLEEIMLVNNGLINTRRELSRKNKELEKLNKELEEVSNIDYLTKIGNRRRFFFDVYDLIKTRDYVLSIIDINNFKIVNDLYGHTRGDQLLCHFANKMIAELDTIDGKIYRLGGDEFATLIPASAPIDYEQLYLRMNREIQQFHDKVSLSYGMVTLNKENVNESNQVEQMMQIADQKMYLMKQAFYKKTGIKKREF